ncbi:Monooxygenase, FAD-binding protein [Cordyceps fumosorosea ARSEF 2679]|uniref:Monooxygenase, FAD-binding protein n=1 Tax=Cordyceps fumosorosea (strain ARSEF 2679) TaxID=1081104 RepID=A0A162MJY8_CORFA|nr:Monooxygenase, FAD-binding protein [Cordyceps fumosorosea ARSEF 2679]OAA53199.1 Monooxygenase, FAD-binding protein [Cordyceps fumosorosea ARSEF 2679]
MVTRCQVIIVGAGPAGLCLALALAKFNVQTVILEKETEVTLDPRGVYLTGDAVRILYDLGIGDELEYVGHAAESVQIHRSSFNAPSFLTLKAGATNALQQAVPEGLLQMQPRLEKALRSRIEASSCCKLLTGSTVMERVSEEPPRIQFQDSSGATHEVEGQWLVGADGKAGVVRKKFLEPNGIKQEAGRHFYDGTSIAANLQISLPTPESHPEFALWSLGYTPEQVYDLFWPKGWHFCCPPGLPTAGGRFGPHSERLWRHEFRCDAEMSDGETETTFWQHILPMVTIQEDRDRGTQFGKAVQYPRDCISILRCRPYHCTHRVVNRWFDKRTILIGDAAHVFPPFAGQGIASGFRDAHQLAWRLSVLVGRFSPDKPAPSWAEALLESWARERRHSVDMTAYLSISLGQMSSAPPNLVARLGYRTKARMDRSARLSNAIDPLVRVERLGMTDVRGGFFASKYRGGMRLAQIYVTQASTCEVLLSDCILRGSTAMTLLVIGDGRGCGTKISQAKRAVEQASLPPSVLGTASIVVYSPRQDESGEQVKGASTEPFELYTPRQFDVMAPEYRRCGGYDTKAYVKRVGEKSSFVIVRADFFVYASAKNEKELAKCLALLASQVGKDATK